MNYKLQTKTCLSAESGNTTDNNDH